MQQYSTYLPVIIQGTIGVLTLLVSGLFYFNYSREKAKNQATKEDIKEITREVESAKKEFIDKTEQLKAELSLANQHKLSWKAAEREAIIDYNQKINSWFTTLMTTNLFTYNYNNYKDLRQLRISHQSFMATITMSEGTLNLFLHDIAFMDLSKNLKSAIMDYERNLSSTIFSITELYEDCEKLITAAQTLKETYISSYNEGAEQLMEDYYDSSKEKLAKPQEYIAKMMVLLSERLKHIVDE